MWADILKKSFTPSFNALVVIAVVVVLMGSAVAVAYSVHISRQRLQEIQRLTAEQNQLDVEWGQLLLEQHAWGAYGRIGTLAVQELHMEPPQPATVVMVQP